MSDKDPQQEILDRTKRIETRVTILANHMGADVGGGKPSWSLNNDGSGRVQLPTRNCSVGELMRVIPRGWSKGLHVYDRDGYLCSLTIVS